MTTHNKPNVKNRVIAGTLAVVVGVPALWYGLSSIDSDGSPSTPVKTATNTYSPPEKTYTSPIEEETTTPTKKPTTKATTKKTSSKPKPTSTEIYYANCTEVWNSGDPDGLRRGEPGYRSGLDSDGDGTACENRG